MFVDTVKHLLNTKLLAELFYPMLKTILTQPLENYFIGTNSSETILKHVCVHY